MRRRGRSDGYYHGLVTLWLTPVVGVAGIVLWWLGAPWWWAPLMVLGNLAGLVLDPDLDHEMVTASEWRVRRVFGVLIGGLWVAVWMPYAMLMPHRGVSHWPVIGTLTRLVYLGLLVFPIGYILTGDGQWFMPITPFLVPFTLGLMVSDIGHWARDYWPLRLSGDKMRR